MVRGDTAMGVGMRRSVRAVAGEKRMSDLNLGPDDLDIDPDAMSKRRVNPLIFVLLIGLAVVAGLFLWFRGSAGQKLGAEERIKTQKNIFVLPAKDQLPVWRALAKDPKGDKDLRMEALTQLALLGDKEVIQLAVTALKDPHHGIRGTCAQVLAHFGKEAAATGLPALKAALNEADSSDKRQIVWALVELKDSSIFDVAMDSYKSGDLTTVLRLEGGKAFDPFKIAKLVSLDKLASRVGDSSPAVRQLVATILSENADKKFTDALVKLVQDKEIAVAREAASGLGRIGDEKARGPLLEALRKADKDSRDKFLQALRDGIGGVGLVLALDTVKPEPEPTNWFQLRQLFDMIHRLADPRTGDALVAWVEKTKPFIHWETEVGIALAEIGDPRAAKYLGKRMVKDNKDIYIKEKFWQADKGGHLTRTDRPRVVAARMLADLAVLRADKRADLLASAEKGVLSWCRDRPQPHANGLRFLAAARSEKGRPVIFDWAFPKEKLPAEGAQPPFPRAYETAQSALRYIGWYQDKKALGKLVKQYERKDDAKMDITQRGLEGAGLAMLGMALRAVTYGASYGLAQWGPSAGKKAIEPMMTFIEDKLWHEEARQAACSSLAWVGDVETMGKVVERVSKYGSSTDPKEQFIGGCYAQTLSRRPVSAAVPKMVELLNAKLELGVRIALGHAVGVAGLSKHPGAVKGLFDKLKDPELRNAAALALILGGNEDVAARAVATYGVGDSKMALNALKDTYFRAFGYWSDKDLDTGNIYRWVRNANAISRVRIGGAPQEWARQRLKAQFDNLTFDNGPHSETRVVLRVRLYQAALKGDMEAKKGAIETLKFMKEQGVLMALTDEKGPVGEMAKSALHALMNPRLVAPEDLSALQEEKKSK
jgi:HEAT repeat protein